MLIRLARAPMRVEAVRVQAVRTPCCSHAGTAGEGAHEGRAGGCAAVGAHGGDGPGAARHALHPT